VGVETNRLVRLGRYTLIRPLGEGGMAELFLARADGIEGFSKLCAVKRILPHRAKNAKFVKMFLNEARLVAALEHPNIAHVYDIGREGGEYYFAMEFVHGQDVRHIVRAAPQKRMRLENALHVAIGVAAGLHHAHDARDPNGRSLDIVHRDVSPSNVLVSYQGSVKLVDFGVAKAASIESETRSGVIKGKFGYMSPEQCVGESLDRRSDVFCVGILLWEMTVGRRLYKGGSDLQTLQRVVYVDAPSPADLVPGYPRELERIVMKALARDRDRRYQTAQELQLDLESFARDRKLNVSAVSMAAEMSELFRNRLDAWRTAEEEGRSLADHLAELSAESSVPSSEADELDDDLDTEAFGDVSHDTSVDKPRFAPVIEEPTVQGRPTPPAGANVVAAAPVARPAPPAARPDPPAPRPDAPIVVPPSPLAPLPTGARREERSHLLPKILIVLVLGAVATIAAMMLTR
jgi:serine/threonine protein kinase